MRSNKLLKPCPNNGIRCGKSTACFPKGTICREDREKAPKNDKINTSTEKIPWKALVAVGTVVTVTGGSLLYLKVKQNNRETMYPVGFNSNTPAPDNLTPKQKTVTVTPSDSSGTEANDSMFKKKKVGLGSKSGAIDNPSKTPYNEEQFKINRQSSKKDIHNTARNWAIDILNDKDTVILDLETTSLLEGLDPYSPETLRKMRSNIPGILQIGLVSAETQDSLDIHLNPGKKIPKIAQEITGNNGKNLKKYATFKEYYPKLNTLLSGKTVLAFNARFDLQVIDALCEQEGLPLIQYKNRPSSGTMDNNADVMHWYGLYMGKGARADMSQGKYDPLTGLAYASLPKLPGQLAHDARSDCWSTLDVLRVMAAGEKPRDMKIEEKKAWDLLQTGKKTINNVVISGINERNSVNSNNGRKPLKSPTVSKDNKAAENISLTSSLRTSPDNKPSPGAERAAVNKIYNGRSRPSEKMKPLISDEDLAFWRNNPSVDARLDSYFPNRTKNKQNLNPDSIIDEALSNE